MAKPHDEDSPGRAARPPALTEISSQPSDSRSPDAVDEPAPAASVAPPRAAPAVEPGLVLHGLVLEPPYDTPLRDVDVRVVTDVAGAPDGIVAALARTDERGAFALELDLAVWRLGDLVSVDVSSAEGRLFTGVVPLIDDLVLLVRQRLVLRGSLVTSVALPTSDSWVAASAPRRPGFSTEVFASQGKLDAGLAFELSARVDRVPDSFELRIGDGRGVFVFAEVPTADLTDADGARIAVDLATLRILALDEQERGLAGVELALAERAVRDGSDVIHATTDEAGAADFWLRSGTYEALLGKAGFASVREEIELDMNRSPLEVHLQLASLGEGDRIGGRVVDLRGGGIADALVSVFPDTDEHEISVAAYVQARSGADGSFELRAASNLALRAVAFQRGRGLSAEVAVQRGRELVLRIGETGALAVSVAGAFQGDRVHSSAVRYALIDAGGTLVDSGHEWGAPFRIEELPEGDFELYVWLEGAGLLGKDRVRVAAAAAQSVEIAMAPARWIDGTVVDDAGAPIVGSTAEIAVPPYAVQLAWAAPESDAAGRFRLLGFSAARGHLRLRRASGAPALEAAESSVARYVLR